MKVLVTGAAGYIGGRMVKALCEKEWVETLVGTDIQQTDFWHPKYRFHKRDIRKPLDDLFKTEEIDTVVHSAYVLPPSHNKTLMEEVNKGGTTHVLNASVNAGVRQILYTSSTTAYGFHPDNDQPLTEQSPLRGNDDFIYAKNKKEIEGMFKVFQLKHPDIKVSIVRPCFVVGPGFKNPMAEHLKKKIVALPSNAKPWQFVHEDDLVDIMVLLLEKQLGGTYNVTADGTMTFAEMVKMLGNIRIPVPWPILFPLNNLAWFLRLSFLSKFPSPAMRLMIHPWIASSEKLINDTGYQFKYTTKTGFADFVRSVKK
ncbi:MAG: NAD-dependent epimerase/dehydratase family protein [Proteobacteria bacterium]|nr:NAD-dependent epimerase/dehydratase family protein [Pseudomonadota bacterium]